MPPATGRQRLELRFGSLPERAVDGTSSLRRARAAHLRRSSAQEESGTDFLGNLLWAAQSAPSMCSSCLPRFRPVNRRWSVAGMFAKPSCTSSS